MAIITPSHALGFWHDIMLELVRDEQSDLTARQTVILLSVYLEPPPHTVRGLAKKLGVTKPAITRALNTLGSMKLLDRTRDASDRRNVLIHRTVEGAIYVEKLGDLIIRRLSGHTLL